VVLPLWVHTVSELRLVSQKSKPYADHITAIQLARLSGFYPIIATASPSNEYLVKSYGATHVFDRHLSGNQLRTAISKVTDSPIGIVYDTISLPETQHIGWGLLEESGILILTLPAAVKEDEGKGRKAIPTYANPHVPQNQELCRHSWVMVEAWLSGGVIQVCSAITVLNHLTPCFCVAEQI
jgi:hypothetical protein